MEQLNGKPLSYYGFLLSKYEGILDMPSRVGETHYDWGDYIAPMVEEEDIFWQSRDFSMKTIFDERLTGRTLQEVISELKNLPECLLESKHGDFTVKIKQVLNIQHYDNISKITILFNERLPQFNSDLPSPVGGTGLLIDGYDLKSDFGIILEKLNGRYHIPLSKDLSDTVFNASVNLSDYRNFNKIRLNCVLAHSGAPELNDAIERFKKLLSQSGYRNISYQGETYSCFLTEGFKVLFSGKNFVKFRVNLNLTSSFFIENGFIEPGFVI